MHKNFTEIQQDLLIGTLLGDGYMLTRTLGRTWRYEAKQGDKQKDYLFHKYEILKPFCWSAPQQNLKISNKKIVWYFRTSTLEELAFFGNKFYAFNTETKKWIKDVPLDIETLLTPRAIAYWYMDDGYLKRKWINYKTRTPAYYFNSLIFCTNSFSLVGVTRLQHAFKTRYGLNFTIFKAKSKKSGIYNQYLLRLSNKEASSFKELIKPFMLDSFFYKLDF